MAQGLLSVAAMRDRTENMPHHDVPEAAASNAMHGHEDDFQGDERDFENLIAEMVATFVRIRAEHIDAEIDQWLERVGRALDLDRANVGEYNRSTGIMRATHCWAREGIPPIPKGINTATVLPELTARALAEETVVFSSRDALPPALLQELDNSQLAKGVKSNVTMPLKVGGAIIGGVAFGSLRRQRRWSRQTLRRLRLVAEVFGSALERKRDIEEIRRLSNELFDISNVSKMGELTASLAHELNQPLGAILNNAQAALSILNTEAPDIQEAREALKDIVRDDNRAADIINHVRVLLHKGEAQRCKLDPREILLALELIMKHDAVMKNISFRVEFAQPLPAISGHKTQLTQALINLVMNAFDAVLEKSEQPRLVLVTAAAREAGRLFIEVRDSGIGIDPRMVPQLFRAFFTTKAKGMGMGLAIVHSVVESHDGEIHVRPNPDGGTTFEIILPTIPHG